ncbi:MAG: phage tail sheath C-terminal domain-containing protein [Pyrinomonadaceae bacterium]
MLNFQTPGVYIREVEVAPPPAVRMDVAGFVGQAERGPLNSPQPLTNWGQFRDIYGDFTGYSYLAYSVFGFFRNGGARCYVVRVAHEDSTRASAKLVARGGAQTVKVSAVNEGAWGNSLTVEVEESSGRELVLTELVADVKKGDISATFKSVAGLSGAGSQPGDEPDTVTLVHRRDPVREKLNLKSVDYATGKVTFDGAVTSDSGFPKGSGVVGRGFKLVIRYRPGGVLVREEVFDNLSMSAEHERYFVAVINGNPVEKDYTKRMKTGLSILARVEDLAAQQGQVSPRLKSVGENDEDAQPRGGGGDDPAKLDARYFTGDASGAYFRPTPTGAGAEEMAEIKEKFFGLAAYEAVDEIGSVAVPDLVLPDLYQLIPPTQISESGIIFSRLPVAGITPDKLPNLKTGQGALLAHCQKMGERFAILDSPRGAEAGKGANRIEEWPDNFSLAPYARYGALYYPWLREKAADFSGRDLLVPPSGHVAGVYARVENREGVGRAPANEPLDGVVEFEFCLTDSQQAVLNPKGVNCLRSFPGRGLLVWGARTLSPDPLWRYVNVRRLSLAIIKQILVNLRWTVFEPNDAALWRKIVATLTTYMRDLFRRGALAGASPQEAFFVKCDAETNTPDVVAAGQAVTEIGFAPARPAEFIYVTIKRTTEAVSVRERR